MKKLEKTVCLWLKSLKNKLKEFNTYNNSNQFLVKVRMGGYIKKDGLFCLLLSPSFTHPFSKIWLLQGSIPSYFFRPTLSPNILSFTPMCFWSHSFFRPTINYFIFWWCSLPFLPFPVLYSGFLTAKLQVCLNFKYYFIYQNKKFLI